MSRFEQVWHGEREPRLRALPASSLPAAWQPGEPGPLTARFDAYVIARLAAGGQTPLELNRLKVRLCDRLAKELVAAGEGPERGSLLERFALALDEIRERELENESPELVERVVVTAPAPSPVTPQQAMGLFVEEA